MGRHSRRGTGRVRGDAAPLPRLPARRNRVSGNLAGRGSGVDANRAAADRGRGGARREFRARGGWNMGLITEESAARLLADLIAIPSANPMGQPWTRSEPVERGVTLAIENLFA